MCPLHGYRVRADSEPSETLSAAADDRVWIHGPCLYLSPRGQRCNQPALEGGFCALHSADAISIGPWVWFRRLAALLVAAAILWPIIEAFLVEISHWRH